MLVYKQTKRNKVNVMYMHNHVFVAKVAHELNIFLTITTKNTLFALHAKLKATNKVCF